MARNRLVEGRAFRRPHLFFIARQLASLCGRLVSRWQRPGVSVPLPLGDFSLAFNRPAAQSEAIHSGHSRVVSETAIDYLTDEGELDGHRQCSGTAHRQGVCQLPRTMGAVAHPDR